jgi:hypothetical protein
MKYILAILACVGLFIAYGILGELLGWRHGGGVIPILVLLAALTATWRAITKTRSQQGGVSLVTTSPEANKTTSHEALTPTNTVPPVTLAQTTHQALPPAENTPLPEVTPAPASPPQAKGTDSILNLATVLPLAGAIGSLIGMFEMPDDFYKILRFLVVGGCVAIIIATHRSSLREPNRTGVFLLFGLLAILFNPILPLDLEPTSWVWLNGVALLLLLGGSVWQMRSSAFVQAHKRTIWIVLAVLSAISLVVFGAPPLMRWLDYQKQLAEWNAEASKSNFHHFKLGFHDTKYIKSRLTKAYKARLIDPDWAVRYQWNRHFLDWVSSGAISASNYHKDPATIQKQLFGEDLLEEEVFDRLREAVNSMTNGQIAVGNYLFDVASIIAFPSGDYPAEPEFSSARQQALFLIEDTPLADGSDDEGSEHPPSAQLPQ